MGHAHAQRGAAAAAEGREGRSLGREGTETGRRIRDDRQVQCVCVLAVQRFSKFMQALTGQEQQ